MSTDTLKAGATLAAAADRPPSLAEQREALWAMTRTERVAAMRAGRLTLQQCCAWAARRPHEVPLLNGEFQFIAALTPEAIEG